MKLTPLVIISGSAGSLEPMQSIFKVLPINTGLAFVVIQHLPRSHESLMPGLLSKCTKMPVLSIVTGTSLEPNHVYLPEPGEFITIHDNKFSYAQSVKDEQEHYPIDFVCQSLSKKYYGHAHLVILSGTGFDGRAGVEAIKQLAGKAVVQEPGSASYPGMPEEVIKKGMYDAILTPLAIAKFLSEIDDMKIAGEYINTNEHDQASRESFEPVIDILSKYVQQDISEYKTATIERRILRRMGLNRVSSVKDYLGLLRNNAHEMELLANDLLIGVTSFFRDKEAFDIIANTVIPDTLENCKDKDIVRVWVAGCSTGEEAYSIAILLIEHLKKIKSSMRVQIFATDLDDAALDVGRNGVYSKDSVRHLPSDYLNEYFIEENERFRVKKILRECIVFATHNLLADPPFSKIDLVICRNLLIYLDVKAQERLLSLFHFILNKAGYLFLGSAESIGSIARYFDVVSKKWRIYHYNSAAPKQVPVIPFATKTVKSIEAYKPTAMPVIRNKQDSRFQEIIDNYGPAQVLVDVDNQLVFMSGNSSEYFALPKGQLSAEINKCLVPQLRLPTRSLINETRLSNKHVSVRVTLKKEKKKAAQSEIFIDATPVSYSENEDLVLLSFQTKSSTKHERTNRQDDGEDWVLSQLEQELDATRNDLNSTIQQSIITAEEARAVNEEMLSMNEELQSSNEELESSKEELQSLNEELLSSNSNLDAKLIENETLNNDLNNLMLSSSSATMLIDKNLTVHLFTPACKKLFRVIESDIGRPVNDLVKLLDDDELIADCGLTLVGKKVPEKTITGKENTCYLRRTYPYLGDGKDIKGIVVTYIDISLIKSAENLLQQKNDVLQWQSDLLDNAAPIIGFDKNKRIIFWNRSAHKLYGWTKKEVMGKDISVLLNTEYPIPLDEIRVILTTKGHWMGQLTQRKKDGAIVVVDSQWTQFVDSTGDIKNIVEVNNDITERTKIQDKLHLNQAMFHTMVDWTYDLEYWLSADNEIIYITPSVKRLTGYSYSYFKNDPNKFKRIVSKEDINLWKGYCARNKRLKNGEVNKVELRIIHKNGESRWLSFTSNPIFDEGSYLGLRVSAKDISRQKDIENEILGLAYYDALTKLPNRRLLIDRLQHSLNNSKRSGQFVAVLMLDLDYFKQINDSKGHDAGDRLLVEVAKRLTNAVRAQDSVSRIGGDEFIILLENIGANDQDAIRNTEEIANKVLRSMRFDYVDGKDVVNYRNSSSIGISLVKDMELTVDVILKQADLALYNAKDAGRDAIRVFDPEMQSNIEKITELKSKLHACIDNNELLLYFQPQYDVNGDIFGAEALLRWVQEKDKIIMPDQFIPLAEQTGFIHEIGAWVLKQAAKQLKAWETEERFKNIELAVNISTKQILHEDFVNLVKVTVKESGCNPKRLKLELTESAFISNVEHVLGKMNELVKTGISFSIDDFGTGYSSLSIIKQLPISELKIDQCFIMHLYKDPNNAVIVKAVLAMAKSLGLQVVAEGVETQKEKDYLFEHGCELLQGYYYSKPVSIEDWNKLK